MNINSIFGNNSVQNPAVNAIGNKRGVDKAENLQKTEGCETCDNRRYQDGSDDEGVSFQAPTKVSPESSGPMVLGHEMEHYNREQAKASREGKEVVNQSIKLKYATCPECGKQYVAGGVTKTTTRERQKQEKEDFEVQFNENTIGKHLPKVMDLKV